MDDLLKLTPFCTVLAFALLLSGCEPTMEGFDDDEGLFSIYGLLDMDREFSYIRVQDLNSPLTEDSTRNLDATVTLENLKSGEREVLQDSVVLFEDVYTHNFRTSMPIDYDTEYRLSVENSKGDRVEVTTTTPPLAEADAAPVMDHCLTPVTVTFSPVQSAADIMAAGLDLRTAVTVGFRYEGDYYTTEVDAEDAGADRVRARFSPQSVLDDVFPPDPEERLWCEELSSDTFTVEYRILGSDFVWHSQTPGPYNIPGGTASLGALYRDRFTFSIDTASVCHLVQFPPNCP